MKKFTLLLLLLLFCLCSVGFDSCDGGGDREVHNTYLCDLKTHTQEGCAAILESMRK